MQKVKRKTKLGKIVKTFFSCILIVVLAIGIFATDTALKDNARMVDDMLGGYQRKVNNPKGDAKGLDLSYNKADYTKTTIKKAEEKLDQQISDEGIVLLKNDNNYLPLANSKKLTFSLVGVNAAKVSSGGGLLGGGHSLKESFANSSVQINQTLWDFYEKGDGSKYGLAKGSVNYGDAEDFRINECPLSKIKADSKVLDSLKGTVPVYFLKRVAGEGRDMPRSMYNHATSQEDKEKSYIEPDSTELEMLSYLNDNFKDSILVVNSNAAVELGWLSNYPNIKTVLYVSGGLDSLPKILTGKVNPSGRTVDTFATQALNSPAAQNIGDYQYFDSKEKPTKYNYVSYKEGIYVGYKYYETRYEDTILKQGNAGDYDYTKEVTYPFGYGLSYTNFKWENQVVTWDKDECTVRVDVTNTGNIAGKDVIELYAQSPYTDYDKENKVEKPSVQLVSYGKTKTLEPNETQTVAVTFKKDQLKAYDYTKAKTYILDAGTYYITAAKDAHSAINNILAKKGYSNESGMTNQGNQDFVATYVPQNTDTDILTYAKDDKTKQNITNQLDEANGGYTYLSRNDWINTWPTHDGKASRTISTWGNEINGQDKNGTNASFTYYKTISDEDLKKLDAFDARNPKKSTGDTKELVYGKKNGLKLTDMRGLDYTDSQWDKLLDQLTPEEYYEGIGVSGYGIMPIKSVNMPFVTDADTASGIIYGGTGKQYPTMMTLAQTWNQKIALDYGKMIGNEMLLGGADGWYAPSMNIHRTPFSGRNGEYYSEDGYFSGTIASAEVSGVSSKGVYAYIKHFAFNDQENHRGDREGQYGIATWLNEQAAREIYLAPFEACTKLPDTKLNYVAKNKDGKYVNKTKTIATCQAIMTSFNRVGYTWSGGDYPLITGILRTEWGFGGMIITDNANTSQYMDCTQMIKAGADFKLTALKNAARFQYDSKDKETYQYAREAMHHMLYVVANSKVTNATMPGSTFAAVTPLTTKLMIGINLGFGLVILVLIYFTVKRHTNIRLWKRKDKSDLK